MRIEMIRTPRLAHFVLYNSPASNVASRFRYI